jgi:hypothetical protein
LKIDKVPIPNCGNGDVKLIVRRLVETVIPSAMTLEEIQIATGQDMELQHIVSSLQTDVWRKELRFFELIKQELCVVEKKCW